MNGRTLTSVLAGAFLVSALLATSGCKQKGKPAAPNTKTPATQPTPRAKAPSAAKKKPAVGKQAEPSTSAVTPEANATTVKLAKANEPPSFEIPVYKVVGVGQEVGFGLEVVDLESDWFKVDLVKKPASATFDPYTLTVTFTPTKEDMPEAHFTVKITETLRTAEGKPGAKRSATHHFAIAVSEKPQAKPHAQPLSPAVEQLITIHDPARLAEVNTRWTIDKMLALNAELGRKDLPKEQQAATVDAAELYKDFLVAMAKAHANPTVDPTSDTFDKAEWGDPKDWKLIAVRARLDKTWHEVRLVWRAKSHAATYAMFKFRPITAKGGLPKEARAYNNKEFGRLVLEHFFTKDGKLNPAHTTDKAAHAKATADFVDKVLKYVSPDIKDKPWAVNGVHALPCEARLGGGTFRDAEGNIAGGDAWGWNALKPKFKAGKDAKSGRMTLANVPLKGFLTGVKPNADGTAYELSCGDAFDKANPAFDKNMAGLCRPSGHTDMPASKDGYGDTPTDGPSSSSFVDAAHLFWDYKNVGMVKSVPLADPRRDLFEEKGMTCHQCHVRKFGVRDMRDEAAWNPKAGLPKGLNKSQPTLYFVITPTTHWQGYTIDFQQKQECKAKVNLAKYAGVETDLSCPLTAGL